MKPNEMGLETLIAATYEVIRGEQGAAPAQLPALISALLRSLCEHTSAANLARQAEEIAAAWDRQATLPENDLLRLQKLAAARAAQAASLEVAGAKLLQRVKKSEEKEEHGGNSDAYGKVHSTASETRKHAHARIFVGFDLTGGGADKNTFCVYKIPPSGGPILLLGLMQTDAVDGLFEIPMDWVWEDREQAFKRRIEEGLKKWILGTAE